MSLQQQQQKAVAQNNNGGPLQKTPPKSAKTANGSAAGSNGSNSKKKVSDKEREKAERESLVLWYHPIQTIKYSSLEMVELLRTYGKKLVFVYNCLQFTQQKPFGVSLILDFVFVIGL